MKAVLALLLAASANSFGQSITNATITVDGQTYTNVVLRKASPTTAVYRHEGGFGSVAITNLAEPYRSKLYNEHEVAEAAAKAKSAVEARSAQALATAAVVAKASMVRIGGRVINRESLPEIRVLINANNNGRISGNALFPPPAFWMEYLRTKKEGDLMLTSWDSYNDRIDRPIILLNAPREATVGKVLTIRAGKVRPIKGFEAWDCGEPL